MIYLLSVYLHVVAACVWIGGLIFFAAVMVPIARQSEPREAARLVRSVGGRFRPLGWLSLGLLVVTGGLNLVLRWAGPSRLLSGEFWGSPFGTTLALKLVVVALILLLTVVHDRVGKASTGKPHDASARKRASLMGRATTILALLAALLGVGLVRGWP